MNLYNPHALRFHSLSNSLTAVVSTPPSEVSKSPSTGTLGKAGLPSSLLTVEAKRMDFDKELGQMERPGR